MWGSSGGGTPAPWPCSNPAQDTGQQGGQGCPGCCRVRGSSQGAERLWVVSSVCVGVSTSECVTQVPANTILWYKTHPEPLLCPFCLHLLPHLTDSSRASQQRPGEGVAPVPIPFLGRKPPCLHGYKSPFPFQPQGVLASPCSVALALTFVM